MAARALVLSGLCLYQARQVHNPHPTGHNALLSFQSARQPSNVSSAINQIVIEPLSPEDQGGRTFSLRRHGGGGGASALPAVGAVLRAAGASGPPGAPHSGASPRPGPFDATDAVRNALPATKELLVCAALVGQGRRCRTAGSC